MSLNGKKITAPVTTTDVRSCLNLATNKISELCSSSRINKWSKHKPIRYDKVRPLTEEERAGSPGDIVEGYYYGVRLCLPGGSMTDLHSMEFDYRAVRRGEDWSRLSDFDGYDGNAVPNPVGTLPESLPTDADRSDVVKIIYDTQNLTGIDISEVIAVSTSSDVTLADMFPCLLLTIGTQTYVRALWNAAVTLDGVSGSQQSQAGFTPMKHNGVWAGAWYILPDGLPDNAGGNATATVLFVENIREQSSGRDWRQWTLVSDGILMTDYLFPCPEAVGRSLTLRKLMTQGVGVTTASWTLHASGTMINVTLTLEWLEPQTGDTYTITGSVKKANGTTIGSLSAEVAYPAGSNFVFKTIAVAELMMTGSENLTLEWTVRSAKFNGAICNSGTTSMN